MGILTGLGLLIVGIALIKVAIGTYLEMKKEDK